MSGNVDADLFHSLDSFKADATWSGSRTLDLKLISGIMSKQAFSHLTARRVSRAENQDPLLTCHAASPQRVTANRMGIGPQRLWPIANETEQSRVPLLQLEQRQSRAHLQGVSPKTNPSESAPA